MIEIYRHTVPFVLESGESIPELEIAYQTFGKMNADKSNVIWVCHALTANADPSDWWSGLVGDGKIFDPDKYYIICANIIGSCYGSTGPTSLQPTTKTPYLKDFPHITVRDMVQAHIILREHLGIHQIHTLIGGSLGGFQALEWSIMESDIAAHLILLCSNAKQSAWGKGIHAAQRLAISADKHWQENSLEKPSLGLKTARAIGLLTYRHYDAYETTQQDDNHEIHHFKVESYLNYQGDKLDKRFDPFTYWTLAMAMDTHDISRGRDKLTAILGSISTKCLLISIDSDQLCPPREQKFMQKHMPHSTLESISSIYGHDGFLIENEAIGKAITNFYNISGQTT